MLHITTYLKLYFMRNKEGSVCQKILLSSLFLIASLMVTNQPIFAGSSSAHIQVSAIVTSSCAIKSDNFSFGSYDPAGDNADAALHSKTTMQISCTKNTEASIGLSDGQYASKASGTRRAMKSASDESYLSYDLYTDAGYSSAWSDNQRVIYNAQNAKPVSIDIYGKIPSNQNVQNGVYSDTIIINATF